MAILIPYLNNAPVDLLGFLLKKWCLFKSVHEEVVELKILLLFLLQQHHNLQLPLKDLSINLNDSLKDPLI